MNKFILFLTFVILSLSTNAQKTFPKNQLSINGFRNPSIGLEYQRNKTSLHAGYYVTNFQKNVTTTFIKIGVTEWFLPIGKKTQPSSFYAGASYLRGLSRDYKKTNALGLETGFRWYAYKGLNFRLGIIALVAKEKEAKFNPTPSISYSVIL